MSYFHSRGPFILLKKAAEAARKPRRRRAVGGVGTWAWRALMFKWLQRLRWCSDVCGARPPLVPHATWNPKCIIDLISHQNGVSAAAAENHEVQLAARVVDAPWRLQAHGSRTPKFRVCRCTASAHESNLRWRFHTWRKWDSIPFRSKQNL